MMGQHTGSTELGAGSAKSFALAAAGVLGLTGLIPAMMVAGEWWLMALTFVVLVATLGFVVLALGRVLSQSGDAVVATPEPVSRPAPAKAPERARRPSGAVGGLRAA